MKVARKIQILVMGIMILFTGTVYLVFHRIEAAAPPPELHPVFFGKLTLGIPESFGLPVIKNRNGWHIKTFRNRKIGTFELATAPAAPGNFQKAAVQYFSLKQFPAHTTIYRAGGSFWFAKNMNTPIPGVLVIRTLGNRRVFTCFFSYDNTFYWVSFTTRRSLVSYAGLFFNVISSIRSGDGSFYSGAFARAAQGACREGYYFFCQPVLSFLLLPVAIGFLIFLLVGVINRQMGRLPDLETLNALLPFYTEANTSVLLKIVGRTQIMSLGMVVNSDGIHLFRFGRLFVEIPGQACSRWEVLEGKGWFGGPYVQITAPVKELVKSRQRFFRCKGNMTVRIYSNQPGMLRQYLR